MKRTRMPVLKIIFMAEPGPGRAGPRTKPKPYLWQAPAAPRRKVVGADW